MHLTVPRPSGPLLLHAMDLARLRGETRFYLTAQHDKLGVYQGLGFVAFGAPFDDGSGILHLAMKTYRAVSGLIQSLPVNPASRAPPPILR